MAGYFLDTSAIVKRYVQEAGTPWICGLTRRGAPDPVYLARATLVEVTSAITRRSRGGSLDAARAASILARFRQHLFGRYQIVEVFPSVWAAAAELAQAHGLRAYDAVQLAAPLDMNRRSQAGGRDVITLISGDRELNAAAQAEGLIVDDPNNH